MNEVLSKRGLNIQEAEDYVQDRREWCSVCRGKQHDVGEHPVGFYDAPSWKGAVASTHRGFIRSNMEE